MRQLGARDALGRVVAVRLRFVGPCVLEGELFDLGAYPGMRLGKGRVVAELYALLDASVIEALDEFEGFDAARPRESLYLRERTTLTEPSGAHAWVYLYNAVPDASTRIIEGDWRVHRARRKAGLSPRQS